MKHIWFLEVFPTLTFSYEQEFCDNYLYEAKTINYFICKILQSFYIFQIKM